MKKNTREKTKKAPPIGDLIGSVIKKLGAKTRFTEEEIKSAWEEAVGEAAARHTKPVSLRKAILLINVDNSGWLYELAIKKKKILKKLEESNSNKKIKDVRLRIGEIK